MKRPVLIIAALRRSGTTAFWTAFRSDRRFRSYNEPFNPTLSRIGDEEWPSRSVHQEYVDLLEHDQEEFWKRYAPIAPEVELQDRFSDRQVEWLKWIATGESPLCVDTTRCSFRLKHLSEVFPDAVLVHLYRPPEAFTRSILLPSSTLIRREVPSLRRRFRIIKQELSNSIYQRRFWMLQNLRGFDYQAVLRRGSRSLFSLRLAEAGMNAGLIQSWPATGRLMAFWKLAFETVEGTGRCYFGDRFLSVPFNEFCESPEAYIDSVYHCLGLRPVQGLSLDHLRRPGGTVEPTHPQWAHYRDLVGMKKEAIRGSI